jgi:hypothetical protein
MVTMTPQARAILVFTLATLALIGWLNRIAFAAYVAFGGDLPGGDGGRLVLSLLTVLVSGGVLWLSHTVAEAGGTGWEASLGQVARVLAALAVVVSVLATIAVLTSDQPFFGSFSLA